MPPKYTPEQRLAKFHSNIDRSGGEDACWEWIAGRQGDGYGTFGWGERGIQLSHRIAYELAYGQFPRELKVLHKCDNPPCCNPKHLFLGTQLENIQDRQSKQRTAYGYKIHTRKLTPESVIDIRRAFASGEATSKELALRYSVDRSTINLIVNNKSWTQITDPNDE